MLPGSQKSQIYFKETKGTAENTTLQFDHKPQTEERYYDDESCPN